MPFPFTMTGSFRIATTADIVETQELLEIALLEWLDAYHAEDVVRSDHRIEFKARFYPWVDIWATWHPLHSSEIWLTAEKKEILLAYRVRFTEVFILITAMVCLVVGPIWFILSNLNLTGTIVSSALIWGLGIGSHYLVSSIRFPKALQNLTRDATGGYIY